MLMEGQIGVATTLEREKNNKWIFQEKKRKK
jgi:hypothetical protein